MDADNFPIEIEFLRLLENAAKACSENTDSFASDSSEKLRATLENLGSTLSVIYRLSCCWFGCKGGDHQIEWLAGRVANQAAAAIGLIRSGYYDESLMLTRGIGEISNLLQLFAVDESHLSAWKRSNRRERIFRYSPRAVREALEEQGVMPVAVDRDRYQALCEVGAHPVPGQPPGHYTGTGRSILGGASSRRLGFLSATRSWGSQSPSAVWDYCNSWI